MIKNNVLTEQEIRDEQELIYYIKTLFNEESKNSEFIYAVAKKLDMPYNLTAISHNSLLKSDCQTYFTISRDRVIRYTKQNQVVEVTSMDEWLHEKLKFN